MEDFHSSFTGLLMSDSSCVKNIQQSPKVMSGGHMCTIFAFNNPESLNKPSKYEVYIKKAENTKLG